MGFLSLPHSGFRYIWTSRSSHHPHEPGNDLTLSINALNRSTKVFSTPSIPSSPPHSCVRSAINPKPTFPSYPTAEALAVTAPVAPKDATAKDDKKGRKKMMGRQGDPEPTPTISAAVETAGAAATGKGDANEAAKMRAVLGFTASAGGSGGGAVAVNDGKFRLSALVGAVRHDAGGGGGVDVGERSGIVNEAFGEDGKKVKKEEKKMRKEEKQRKKEEKKAKRAKQRQESSKKRKKAESSGGEESSEGEEEDFKEQKQGTAAVPAATTTVVKPAATAAVSGGTQPTKDNRPHAPSNGKVNGQAPGGQKHFTFNFEVGWFSE